MCSGGGVIRFANRTSCAGGQDGQVPAAKLEEEMAGTRNSGRILIGPPGRSGAMIAYGPLLRP